MKNLLILILILVASYIGFYTGYKGLGREEVCKFSNIPVEEFLKLCLDEPEADCNVFVIEGEPSFRLRMDELGYEGIYITSITQAQELIETGRHLRNLKKQLKS